MTSLTSRPVIFIPRYSGVLPDMSPTMKTVMITYMIMYINPTPMPPGVAWISMPMNAAKMTSGFMAKSEEFTEPVVTAVVTTVHNTDMKPPILVSIPGPIVTGVGMNAMIKSTAKRTNAAMIMGMLSFFFPRKRPYTNVSAVGMSSIRIISRTFEAGFGF